MAAAYKSRNYRNLQLASAALTSTLPLIHAIFIRGVKVTSSLDNMIIFGVFTFMAFICLSLSYQYLALSRLQRYLKFLTLLCSMPRIKVKGGEEALETEALSHALTTVNAIFLGSFLFLGVGILSPLPSQLKGMLQFKGQLAILNPAYLDELQDGYYIAEPQSTSETSWDVIVDNTEPGTYGHILELKDDGMAIESLKRIPVPMRSRYAKSVARKRLDLFLPPFTTTTEWNLYFETIYRDDIIVPKDQWAVSFPSSIKE